MLCGRAATALTCVALIARCLSTSSESQSSPNSLLGTSTKLACTLSTALCLNTSRETQASSVNELIGATSISTRSSPHITVAFTSSKISIYC